MVVVVRGACVVECGAEVAQQNTHWRGERKGEEGRPHDRGHQHHIQLVPDLMEGCGVKRQERGVTGGCECGCGCEQLE